MKINKLKLTATLIQCGESRASFARSLGWSRQYLEQVLVEINQGKRYENHQLVLAWIGKIAPDAIEVR